MNTFDLISDISTISTIPDKTLRKLSDKGIECICHSVLETINDDQYETSIDIGIGTLKIIKEAEELHYRFVPSNKLEQMLVSSITTNTDPLIAHIEESLNTRILNTYKDLI